MNWEPWSVVKLFGVPCRAIASSTASRQKSPPVLAEIRHARTRRLNGGDRLARQALTAQGLDPIDRGLRWRLAQLVEGGNCGPAGRPGLRRGSDQPISAPCEGKHLRLHWRPAAFAR